MATTHTDSQVYPGVANLQAVFTALGAGCYFMDLIQVCAVHDVFMDKTVALPPHMGVSLWLTDNVLLTH